MQFLSEIDIEKDLHRFETEFKGSKIVKKWLEKIQEQHLYKDVRL